MEKVSENPLLFCRNLKANGAQFSATPCRYLEENSAKKDTRFYEGARNLSFRN